MSSAPQGPEQVPERWARDSYRRNYVEPRTRHEHNLALRRAACLELVPPEARVLLDVGCGAGGLTIPLATPGRRVVAVDVSWTITRAAARVAATYGATAATFCVGDARGLPFEREVFDAVVIAGVLEYVHDLHGALAEARRVLRPGGTLVATMTLLRRLERRVAALVVAARARPARDPVSYPMTHEAFDAAIAGAGFAIMGQRTVAFAPFPLDALAPRLMPLFDRVARPVLERVPAVRALAKTYVVGAVVR